MGQDCGTSAEDAEGAMSIVWVKEDGRLMITSLGKLDLSAQQHLAQQGCFMRVKGDDVDKNYILVGKTDLERGFVVVDYETIEAVPWVFEGHGLVHPSRQKYAATYTADGLWEIMDYDLECHAPDEGPWTAASARRKPARRPAGRWCLHRVLRWGQIDTHSCRTEMQDWRVNWLIIIVNCLISHINIGLDRIRR